MKRLLIPVLIGLPALTLLTGCLDLHLGGGTRTSTTSSDQHPAIGQEMNAPTLGQELIDLQKAKNCGAITDQEYQQQKAKLLGIK